MPPQSAPAKSGWSYLPALDGLRAVAVVAVVLFHFWPDVFGGGFVGVDIFFVLSGFLITGIILAEVDRTQGLDLRAFWGRRIRRLVPAVLVLVSVCALAVFATDTGSARGFVDSVGALTWTTNWLELAFRNSRWFVADDRTVLDHLWSLAIEEQFYLVWPPVLLWLCRRGLRGPRLVGAIAAMSAASVAAMGWAGPLIGYFRTDARAFELLAGAGLAASGWRPGRRVSSALVAVGLVVLVVYIPLGDPQAAWMYPLGFVGLTAAFTGLVAGSLDAPPLVGAALTHRAVRHVGRVSYGIYLWHLPVLRIVSEGRLGVSGPLLHLCRFVILGVLVELSYRFVEEPLRHRRFPFRLPQMALGYGAAILALLAYLPGVARSFDHQWDTASSPPAVDDGQVRVMVTGDLMAVMIGAGMSRDDAVAVYEVGDLECAFVDYGAIIDGDKRLENDPYCVEWESRWENAAEEFSPEIVVYASGYWDSLQREVEGVGIGVGDDDLIARFGAVAEAQMTVLDRVAPHAVVVVIEDVSDLAAGGQRDRADRQKDLDAWNAAVRTAAQSRPGITVVSLDDVGDAAALADRAEEELVDAVLATP